ncbi:hypothetical protein ILUMI_20389 [Ignelater luminosus]|uniref:Uncharacterized protein n=1 Tax=Ignelater luminosus TaxID=2038154 RepID=A0A8K0CGG5_IGNLU|nr:hypothetical protein ILUMI_20389 [Ignelater luminosus]
MYSNEHDVSSMPEQQEFENETKQLKEENKKLNEKIEGLENRITVMENERRKDNIVINGLKVANEGQLQCEDIESFLENNLKVKTKLKSVKEIKIASGQRIVMAKCEALEQKLQIIKAKSKLKGTQCFIEDDLTKEERKIQAILRNKARNEREKRNTAKIGYTKLIVNDEVWEWNGKDNVIVKRHIKS